MTNPHLDIIPHLRPGRGMAAFQKNLDLERIMDINVGYQSHAPMACRREHHANGTSPKKTPEAEEDEFQQQGQLLC